MNIVLLLGSGVSKDSGMPLVCELTEAVLKDDCYKSLNQDYLPGPDPTGRTTDLPRRIQEMLLCLKDENDAYLNRLSALQSRPGLLQERTRESTYEDLYYLVDVIERDLKGRATNLPARRFVEEIHKKKKHLFTGGSPLPPSRPPDIFAWDCKVFIQSVVRNRLNKPCPPVGFDLLIQLVKRRDVDRISIVTLNHDTLVEQYLTSNGRKYVDGFGRPDGDVRWYSPDALATSTEKVRVIKLHGSVDRHVFRDPHGTIRDAVFVGKNVYKAQDGSLNHIEAVTILPSFLTGQDKEMSYNSGIYGDLHFHFQSDLTQTHTVIMSGFGWNDLGISNRLLWWLYRDPTNRIILLHKDPDTMVMRSRGLREHEYQEFQNSGQLILIRKWFSNTTLADLLPHL